MKNILYLLINTLLIIFISPLLVFGQITAYSSVDKDSLSLSDQITLTITISGSENVKEPKLIGINNFEQLGLSSSQSVQIINGLVSTTIQYSYTLRPKRPGTFKLGSADININGQILRTNPITVTVLKENNANQQTPVSQNNLFNHNQTLKKQDLPGNLLNNDILIDANISNINPYENEQVIYTVKIYLKKELKNANIQQPDFKDFLAEQLNERKQSYIFIEGQYYTLVEQAYALFPTTTGNITIQPTKLVGNRVNSTDPFDFIYNNSNYTPVNIQTKSLLIKVKEIPNKPPNYKDMVGKFDIKTEIDNNKLKTGETATLTITLSGKGNLKNAQYSDFIIDSNIKDSFKVYSRTPKTITTSKVDYISCTKTFKYDLVPLKTGKLITPILKFVYFDPSDKTFHTLKSEKKVLDVSQGTSSEVLGLNTNNNKSSNSSLGDILDIHASENSVHEVTLSIIDYIIYFIILILPIVCLLIIYFYKKHTDFILGNDYILKEKKAYNTAKIALKNLKSLVIEDKEKELLINLDKIIKEYLGSKLNIPGGALTTKDVENLLKKHNLEAKTILFTIEILNSCERIQYSTSNESTNQSEMFYIYANKAIKQLEKELGK